jgi:hypothetical protein
MTNILEAIFFRHRRLNKEQVHLQAVEPATGERQRTLKNTCREILQHQYFSDEDVSQFTESMIWLLGGTVEQRGHTIKKQSHPFIDLKNEVSLSLERKRIAGKYTSLWEYSAITVEGPTLSERLEYGAPVDKSLRVVHGPVLVSQIRLEISPTFNSYISGKPENLFPDGIVTFQRRLSSNTEGRQFCERMFNIYQETKN